ncbi:cyclic-di-AMP-binding protein CbpB [Halalkalibacterium ligniniphilum]|uniref:cyclic-di-AMP-binding protein CbpB n=1 Tax=Halalkalibacterium ligniniphilum TaxID=1134413 RepID=UPI000477239D|nr:cyclic-di-AMP-binding protein CbpB [Halalkalibacterium ligniniphilum]
MQKLSAQNIMDNEIKELVIPSEKVAHVQLNNPLEHALLVLVKSGYTAIPVLDTSFKLHGLISKSLILDSLLGLERIEMERLNELKVQDVMEASIPSIHHSATFSKALTLSINHPFICILDDDGSFLGILTRRSILALINRYFHKLKS